MHLYCAKQPQYLMTITSNMFPSTILLTHTGRRKRLVNQGSICGGICTSQTKTSERTRVGCSYVQLWIFSENQTTAIAMWQSLNWLSNTYWTIRPTVMPWCNYIIIKLMYELQAIIKCQATVCTLLFLKYIKKHKIFYGTEGSFL